MNCSRWLAASCAALAVLAGPTWAQVRVGVVSSATGPTAVVGIPQKNTVALLPRRIGDLTVDYIAYDDASDATQTVTLFKKLISEHKVDAIIGPTGSPNAMAVIPFVAEAGVPLLAPVGTTAVVLPMDEKKRWVFKTTQNDGLIAEALIGHMKKRGVRTVGFIGYNDPYGESWLKEFSAQAQKAGIALSAVERYQRTDQSVTGQVLKLLAAKPDAVLVAGTGGPAVLPHLTLVDQGYKGAIYQTHGAATPEFIRLGGKKVEGSFMAASLMLALNEIPDSNPSKPVAQGYIAAYEKLHGAKAATFGANVYDAGLLLKRAIPLAAQKGKPGSAEFRAALRDALEQTKEFVATQGVYNMSAEDHSGFDQRGRVMLTIRDHGWRLVGE
ncbi:MAG: ABC transporter substrate-binding protein [Gammaproteobacteria bacterium]|nr:ABC transporter substrate-binding protein [Gammaproteobacteria bacterium]MBU1645159.1 ABC transporter substrate-binding protein [Gammaproteobacteria bacterium]MBU1973396.1 ABC transporter substrate-binding protein [Gammaproteobacteria bacterium]